MCFNTDYGLMQVKSIAECSPWSILQYFWPSLSYHLSLRSLFCLFLSLRSLFCVFLSGLTEYQFVIFSQSSDAISFVIWIQYVDRKQCESWSASFQWSQLIRNHTTFKGWLTFMKKLCAFISLNMVFTCERGDSLDKVGWFISLSRPWTAHRTMWSVQTAGNVFSSSLK